MLERDITGEELHYQIVQFKNAQRYVRLERPCFPGCGIRVLTEEQRDVCSAAFDEACGQGRFSKFTPASSAAGHMFTALLSVSDGGDESSCGRQSRRAKGGEAAAREVRALMDRLGHFAFYEDLKGAMARDGVAIESCIAGGRCREILDYLLSERGLDYAALPKGLLKVHCYPSGSRTAFEEQLVEAAATVRDRRGVCRLHFTVSPQHLERFRSVLEAVRPAYETRYRTHFAVDFSLQHPQPDPVAADVDQPPPRDAAGRLLGWPGGCGALLDRLNDLGGDLVFIKTIDNVLPDELKGPSVRWKKILGGYLVRAQREIFRHLSKLRTAATEPMGVSAALHFAKSELCVVVPAHVASEQQLRDFLIAKLDRPVRVCGMVRSEYTRGGGPFWVKGRDGTPSLQIVDSAQVDREAPDQQAMLNAATHFNPLDLVCGVRNWRGQAFDLGQHADPAVLFPPRRSNALRNPQAECSGLWTGAMADWNSIFVEVPAATCRSVETVFDLRGPEVWQGSPPEG